MKQYIKNAKQCFVDDKLKIVSIRDWGNKVLIKSMVKSWMADHHQRNEFIISKPYLIRLVNNHKPHMIKQLKDQFILN
tara:strand:- start:212 stop:445 length:234 start_codon:yes stop_codon:yes gene_type:complete